MITPAKAIKRITSNNQREFNRLDREDISMHRKVYNGYKNMINKYPKGIVVIDASLPLDKVVKQVNKALDKKLAN